MYQKWIEFIVFAIQGHDYDNRAHVFYIGTLRKTINSFFACWDYLILRRMDWDGTPYTHD